MSCQRRYASYLGEISPAHQNRINRDFQAAVPKETVPETTDRPVVHSERGGHYCWPGWLSRMSEANFTRSMFRNACSPDNAACEGFLDRLTNELSDPRDWKNATIEQFFEAVDSYNRRYNEKRINICLAFLIPIEYRVSLGLAAQNQPSFFLHTPGANVDRSRQRTDLVPPAVQDFEKLIS